MIARLAERAPSFVFFESRSSHLQRRPPHVVYNKSTIGESWQRFMTKTNPLKKYHHDNTIHSAETIDHFYVL